MDIRVIRHPANPIVRPGKYPWRRIVTFNPGVIRENGKVYMYERTAGQLRPFICYIGMLVSDDGVIFSHVGDHPVFTPEKAGSRYGSVQDPRVVRIERSYYMTYAFRPYAWSSNPTGYGVPESHQTDFQGFDGDPLKNMTRSGIARSEDLHHWEHYKWATPEDMDDRDVVLFPEKINGRYAMLRRPLQFVGPGYGTDLPGIWISFSEDMETWQETRMVIRPEFDWENSRIGASLPPIKTGEGWLVIYHGVEKTDEKLNTVIYRVGAMILDLNDPSRVIKRSSRFIMEPEAYYEKFGLYIPNVIFPTGGFVEQNQLYLYYGACDTAIALAIIDLDEILLFIDEYSV
jgi:predicted GH43/DUF377 family glycosyl hydrolase